MLEADCPFETRPAARASAGVSGDQAPHARHEVILGHDASRTAGDLHCGTKKQDDLGSSQLPDTFTAMRSRPEIYEEHAARCVEVAADLIELKALYFDLAGQWHELAGMVRSLQKNPVVRCPIRKEIQTEPPPSRPRRLR